MDKGMPLRQYGTNRNRPDEGALMAERTLTAPTCAEVHACRATVECAVEQRRRRRTGSEAHVQNITEKESRRTRERTETASCTSSGQA